MRLNELRSQLRSFLSGDWSGILLNPNFVQHSNTMTWHNCHLTMVPESLSFKDVAALSKERQYSFQLSSDGSLFQFYYAYDRRNRDITEARIAFYEANGSGFASDASTVPPEDIAPPDTELTEGPLPVLGPGESLSGAIEADLRRPRWFRIDFRAGATKCVLHNDCHLHFGGFPGSRLVVAGVPTPKQFVEFVISCCYPDLYQRVRLNQAGAWRDQKKIDSVNATHVAMANPLFKQITHLRIPGS